MNRQAATATAETPHLLPNGMVGMTAVLVLVGLALTIFAGPLFDFSDRAAAQILTTATTSRQCSDPRRRSHHEPATTPKRCQERKRAAPTRHVAPGIAAAGVDGAGLGSPVAGFLRRKPGLRADPFAAGCQPVPAAAGDPLRPLQRAAGGGLRRSASFGMWCWQASRSCTLPCSAGRRPRAR